jgi:nucleotide-binding universal stress UspA family protein
MATRADIQNPVVVVGIDYSEPALQALKRAVDFARHGALHVVHVVDALPPSPMLVTSVPTAESLEIARRDLRAWVDEQIALFAERDGSLHLSRVFTHVATGAPGVAVAQLASDLEADLIVVGTHGRRGFQRLLLGSVAESVLRLAQCPVFVERPKGGTSEVPVIEPACPVCVETRKASGGERLWCDQHSQRRSRPHTYYSTDRSTAFPSNRPGMASIS